MSSSTTPQPAPAVETGLSEPERILNTFIAPNKTFADIRRNASWWVPWLLLAVTSLAFSIAFARRVGWETVMEQQIAKNPTASARMDAMKPEQRERILALQVKVASAFAYCAPLINLLWFVIAGAVAMAIFNFAFGAEIRFKESLAVFTYANLPLALSAILTIVSIYASSTPETININNPLASNPAYFLDAANSRLLYWLASCLDAFGIWVIVLLGIGYGALSKKVKPATAMAIFFVIYAVFKGLSALRA